MADAEADKGKQQSVDDFFEESVLDAVRRETKRPISALRAVDPATWYARQLAKAEREVLARLERQSQTEDDRNLQAVLAALREHDARMRQQLRVGLREIQQAQGPTEIGQL